MKADITGGGRDKYYSQLDNELNPYISCQVTSMVMGLDIGGFGLTPIRDLPCGEYRQPEDKLRRFMLDDPGVQDFCKRSHPGSALPAPEWADCMVFAINKLYGANIVYFDAAINTTKIKTDIMAGMPVYTSMKYPANKNFSGKPFPVSGHIVLVVGFDETSLIINDPYKNHLTGDRDGFCNVYSAEEFAVHNKGYAIRFRENSGGNR